MAFWGFTYNVGYARNEVKTIVYVIRKAGNTIIENLELVLASSELRWALAVAIFKILS